MDLYCDRIPDRQLENAVVHALTLMRQGYRPNIANAEAARAYGYATSDVSHYTGQHASRIRAARKSGGRAGNPITPSKFDSDSLNVTLKVTPALVRELTGTTLTVSKDLCRYIANDLTEKFGEWSDRGAKYAVRSTLAENEEDLKELVADMDNSFGPKPTDLVTISVDPYLLRETYGDHRHPCTKDDLMKVAKYIEKHYFTSEKGGFKLVEEAMRNEGVWYGSDDDDYRMDNPAATGIRAAQAEVKRLRIERDKAKFRAEQQLATYGYDVWQNGLDLLIRDANAFQAAQKRLEAAERAVDELRHR